MEGNIQSELGSRTSRAQLLGTVYCSELLDENKFKATISDVKKYTLVNKLGLRNNDADIHTFETSNEVVEIKSVQLDRGFIYLNLSIEGRVSKTIYRVLSFSDSRILVAYREGQGYYNLVLSER